MDMFDFHELQWYLNVSGLDIALFLYILIFFFNNHITIMQDKWANHTINTRYVFCH